VDVDAFTLLEPVADAAHVTHKGMARFRRCAIALRKVGAYYMRSSHIAQRLAIVLKRGEELFEGRIKCASLGVNLLLKIDKDVYSVFIDELM
jgi:hypothetical protein